MSNGKSVKVEGFDVIVSEDVDTNPDTSHLGEYVAQRPALPFFDRALGRVIVRADEQSAPVEEEDEAAASRWEERHRHQCRYITAGDPGFDAEAVWHDAQRLESFERQEWSMLYIRAEVFLRGVKLGESTLYGVESDSDPAYFREVERDQIKEAVLTAKTKLAELKTA